jgi:Fe-S-cluster containining protein
MDGVWYDKGLAFECTGCGACCRTRGAHAYVYLTAADVAAAAAHLGLEGSEFCARFCETDADGSLCLLVTPGDCVLLDADGRCRAYPARPKQCATWPFWTENLVAATWYGAVKSLCPGAGCGRIHSRSEIEAIAKERDDWYGIER